MKPIALLATAFLSATLPATLLGAEGGGWISLFDGKSLAGWTLKNGTAAYRVQDGTIVGKTAEGSPNTFLCTERDYADFELEFDVKVDARLNSGVQIRSKAREQAEGREPAGRVYGPQVEIVAGGATGALAGYVYGEATGRGWLTPKERLKAHQHFRDGEWNHFRVLAQGPHIQTWINGTLIDDLTDEPIYKTHPTGFISLQVHSIPKGQGPYEVAWKNIRLRELK